MGWFCAIHAFGLAFLGRIVRGKRSNLLSVFTGFYGITISLASMRLYELYELSTSGCLAIMLGLLFFAVGYFYVISSYQKKFGKSVSLSTGIKQKPIAQAETEYALRKVVFVVLIVIVAYCLWELYRVFRMRRSGMSMTMVRGLYFSSSEEYGRGREDVYVFGPLLQVLVILSSAILFYPSIIISTKKKAILSAGAFLCAVMMVFVNGGRALILYSILLYFYSYAVNRKKASTSPVRTFFRKQKKRLGFMSIIMVVVVLVMTSFRRGDNIDFISRLFRSGYIYLSGWVPNFDIRLELSNSLVHTNGYCFILGFIKIPAAFLHRVMQVPASSSYSAADLMTSSLQERVSIGNGISFNAYVSLFYYFYRDFGYWGIMIESALFGMFCAICEKKYELKPNLRNLTMLLFAFYLVISSMVRWGFVHPTVGMMFYYIPLFFKKRKTRSKIMAQE